GKSCGVKPEDLVGKTDLDIWPSELAERYRVDDRDVMATGRRISVEEPLADKEGKTLYIETIKSPIYDTVGKIAGTVGIARDITERKRREEELKKAYIDLKEMQERLILSEKLSTRGELAAGIAHEIRNPLSVISMTVQYLQSKFEVNDPRREYTESIIQKVERLDKIARGLTDYSRSPQLNIKNKNLTRILSQTISLIKPKCRINKIKIIQKFRKTLPLAPVDEEKIDQVFLNIINNAVEAMPKGGKLYIETGYNEETKEIAIKIKDTGKGLAPKSIKNIFNPFFTTKKAEGGVGLGLSISHNIIISHNGTIDVESKTKGKDKGATFIIKLPAAA
ncbi:MAG: ATP-binding protein, partial [bacterium]